MQRDNSAVRPVVQPKNLNPLVIANKGTSRSESRFKSRKLPQQNKPVLATARDSRETLYRRVESDGRKYSVHSYRPASELRTRIKDGLERKLPNLTGSNIKSKNQNIGIPRDNFVF